MQNSRTLHSTSDRLEDRYPYYPEDACNKAPFAKEIRPDEVFEAFGRQALPKLVRLLQYAPLSEAKRVEALTLLAGDLLTTERAAEAVTAGALEAAAALFESGNAEIRALSARCVGAMLSVRSGRLRAAKSCAASLVGLLADEARGVRAAAACGVRALAAAADGAALLAAQPALVAALVAALPDRDGCAEVDAQVLLALESVSRSPAGVAACLAARAERTLVGIAAAADRRHAGSAAQVTWNLASLPAGTRRVIEAGAVPVLAGIMRRDAAARRVAAGALLAASVDKAGKQAIGAGAVVDQLCETLLLRGADADAAVRTNVCETIRSASELPAVREAFVRRLVLHVDTLESVLGASSAPVLFAVLKERRSEQLAVAAVSTLLRIAKGSDQGCKDVYGCLYAVETLTPLKEDTNEALQRLATQLLDLLWRWRANECGDNC